MLRRKALLGMIIALTLVAAACGDDAATPTTAATTTTEAVTTTVATFDLVASVEAYASTIPDGFMGVSDLTAFKDALTAGAYLIDVREVSDYEAGHIPGAVNIPIRTLADNLAAIPTDQQVFVYCASGWRAGMATSALRMLGYDNVLAYPPSMKGWTDAGETVETTTNAPGTFTVPTIEPELLTAVGGFLRSIPDGFLSAGDVEAVKTAIDAGAFLVDVRSATEYANGYIPGAMNIDLRTLPANLSEIPTDQQVIVYCQSGWRAALSTAVLQVLGYDNVKGFPGSYAAWTAAGEPVATP
jgi:rhodanese-related sulfurtransferase